MSFNPTKCEFLRITNKKTPLIHSYYIATSLIKEVTSIKYLRVRIDNKLTWIIIFSILLIKPHK